MPVRETATTATTTSAPAATAGQSRMHSTRRGAARRVQLLRRVLRLRLLWRPTAGCGRGGSSSGRV